MLVIPGLTYLIAFVAYIDPVDIWEGIKNYPFVHIGMALAMLGFILDIHAKLTKVALVPHFFIASAFVGWCVITDLVMEPAALLGAGNMIIQSFLIFFMLAHGVTTFRGFRAIVTVMLILDMAAALVAVTQYFGPYTCSAGGKHINLIDGRPCDPDDKVEGQYGVGQIPRGCTEGDETIADVEYRCEKLGIWGMNTNQGRATAFGWLTDSNDVALMTGVGLPFAFAFRERRKKSLFLFALWLFFVVMFGLAAVATKSRGGQLVFGTVLLVYFINKYGPRGLIVAVIGAAPLLALGGRSSTEASNSANHRIELWWAGIQMFFGSPIFGVGCKQFMKHSADACHSAYINALAETGLPGYCLYLSICYVSVKIPWEAYKHTSKNPNARIGAIYSLATLAAIIGLHVDLIFLSHTYNYAIWLHYGLAGALYSCIKRHYPEFKVGYSWREFLIVFTLGAILVILIIGVNLVSPPEIQIQQAQ